MNNLVWFRNDLRVNDNNSLFQACENAKNVIGLYCLDPRQFETNKSGFKKTEKFRAKFLLETLRELKNNLALKNIPFYVFHDLPENIIPDLVSKHQIDSIFLQKEWTPDEVKINTNLQELQNLKSVNWIETFDQFLFHPSDIPYQDFNKIPEIFTEFRKKCEKESKNRSCVSIEQIPSENFFETSNILPSLEDLGLESFKLHKKSAFPFRGGENQALKRVENYFFETENLSEYKKTRNGLIGESYSSKLSAWLANGSISARTIYWQVQEYENQICKNENTYWLIFELIWRDYFKYISLKHGDKIFKLDGILQKQYEWKLNDKAFRQWINGNTKEPFVNANMIELQNTGFMSNRGRQNVASFWAKEWEQDWRFAAAYFESMLIDYDVHSNYGNWIYNAGVGNDPRDRKFNIKRQAEMYDGKGEFQKLWLNV
ncbi:DASH family cryptochrome [Flavobacterium gelidilacus]|uniref:DASH family cryptochrome n=1 Tax=Flavobacterium gelidilacus TaxID=206041 RepID=UPI00041FCE5E|nr:DASH family cryptochrome [Flavobacterium gelidilacus]